VLYLGYVKVPGPHSYWNLTGGGPDYRDDVLEVVGNIYQNPELLEGGDA
jgi:YopX protein